MTKKHLLVLFFLVTLLSVKAQQQFFLGFQNGWAYGVTSIEQKKKYLKNKSFPWVLNTKLSLQYRVANTFSIEGGISNESFIWKVVDKDFEARYDDRFEAKMANKIGHLSFFANIQYAFELPTRRISSTNHLYFQLGGGYHHYGAKLLSQSKGFIYGGDVIETIRMETQYNKGAYYIAPEIGLQKLYRSTMFSVGIMGAFNVSNNMFKSNYTSTQPDGTIVTSDRLTASGSYIGVNLRFNLSLMYKEKKERPVKEKAPKKKKKKEKLDTVSTNVVKPEQVVVDTAKKVVNGRDYEVTHKLDIHTRMVKIKVWDDKEVDGDSINLSFNGSWVLKEYQLTRKPREIEVELKDGVNDIVLYALNLGKYPPNTAAVSVFDGKKWQRVVLESTLDNSGALQIVYSPPEKE